MNKRPAIHKMTLNVPIMGLNASLSEAKTLIEKNIKKYSTINYIYMVDEEKKLKAVFSIKDLYESPPDTKVEKISVKSPLISVLPETSQEVAAVHALRHNIKAMPVVDKNGIFLGVIPSDTILSIIYKEAREDLMRIAGVHPGHAVYDDILKIPFLLALKHRIPWIIIGLFGGVFAASIIDGFEDVLKNNLVLASFIPLIVYMGGAVNTQIVTFAVRDLSSFHKIKFWQYFLKHLSVVMVIAVLSGIILASINSILGADILISLVLGVALIFAVLSSVFTGLVVPFVFNKLKIDPANASGPIATIIQDILSIVIYFSVASWLLF